MKENQDKMKNNTLLIEIHLEPAIFFKVLLLEHVIGSSFL